MKNLRRQSWLVTLSLVLLAAGYVWFVFLPGKAAIGLLEAELNDRRAFVAGGNALVLSIGRVERDLESARGYSRKWRPEPSGSAAAAARFGRIAQVLQQAGVSTTRFAPEAAVKLESLEKLPLRICCTGSFDAVCGMLGELEKLDDRCWIEELSLEQATEDGQNIKCDLGLAIFADNSKKSD